MLTAAAATSNSVDTTVFAAFAVGFVSFISPCVLPLVPGYLSAVSGVSVEEMRGDERVAGRVLGPAIVFCLSFTLMFVALGMTATGIGSTLRDHQDTLNRIAGWLIIVMGAFFVATLFVPRLNWEFRPTALIQRAGTGGPIIAGLAFAVAWTPCVGPTLASILAAASTSDTVGKGGILLACYSLGLAIPFLLTAVAFDRATTAFRWLRDRHVLVTAVSGAVLIVMGTLIVSGELATLNTKAQHALSGLGLDFLYNI
jgi:cytochrome c-type biogenesis protein